MELDRVSAVVIEVRALRLHEICRTARKFLTNQQNHTESPLDVLRRKRSSLSTQCREYRGCRLGLPARSRRRTTRARARASAHVAQHLALAGSSPKPGRPRAGLAAH